MNPVSSIDWGGILIIFILILIVAGIIIVRRLLRGDGLPRLSFSNTWSLMSGKKAKVSDTVRCLNVYADRIVVENMLTNSTCKEARIWDLSGKKILFQKNNNREYKPLLLPEVISFPPERLARMMGCEPLKALMSMRFTWMENLAPFAPVIALGIGALLFIIVLG